MLEYLSELDTNWFLFLNGFHNPFWDKIMWHISATITWIPLYLIIIIFVFKQLKLSKAIVTLVFFALLVLLADQTSVHLFKDVFERLRPCHNTDIQTFVHTVNGKCGGKYGFVSSHAANTFALAAFLVFFFKNNFVSLFFLIWASIVSYSRIYLGVHYVFDIIGGALWGAFIGYIVSQMYKASLKYLESKSIFINQ